MGGKLIITETANYIVSALYDGKLIVELKCDSVGKRLNVNDIYIGKVQHIVKSINAAFIEIYPGQKGYYPLDENRSPYFINPKNTDKVCEGDQILVQVAKEAGKSKDPVLTSNITLTGKLAVLMYGKNGIGFSGKIKDASVKKAIKEAIKELSSETFGFIIRTNAANAEISDIVNEMKALTEQLKEIFIVSKHRTCYSCIYSAPVSYLSSVKDAYDGIVDEIITDNHIIYKKIEEYLSTYQKADLDKLTLYEDKLLPLKNRYSINKYMKEALSTHVWLGLGGYLVIEPTEAMVVIDVNTGKYAVKKNKSEAILKLNLEAAKEVARQIRLRNLSGIIIVDFINMELYRDREILLSELEKYVHEDPVKTTVVGMTTLQLVEITRKKSRRPLYETVTEKKFQMD